MFRKALEEWFATQQLQIEKAYGSATVVHIEEILRRRKLDPESIDADLAENLYRVLSMTYEEPIGSSRLAGHGWTVNHIKEHMKRALKSKFEEVSVVVHEILVASQSDEASREDRISDRPAEHLGNVSETGVSFAVSLDALDMG